MAGRNLNRLLHEGDWACAYGERARLSEICEALVPIVDPEASAKLRQVADGDGGDERSRRRLWAEVAFSLRHPAHT
jgi:hypothetical protein